MLKKILVAEDHEVRNLGMIKTLEELNIKEFKFVSYCDDALQEIKNGISSKLPYDLLITDLSFEEDHRTQTLKSGFDLINALQEISTHLKIIVFSIEKKPKIIEDLIDNKKIDGFVSKSRNDAKVLKETITKVFNGETVIPFDIKNSVKKNSFAFSEYDITLLQLISKGMKQQEIADYFRDQKITPNSRSGVEKHLNDLREVLNTSSNIEMILICKDLGIL